MLLNLLGGGFSTTDQTFNLLVNFMRMIGLGLMGFLLAGVALLLSTMNFWERAQWLVQSKIYGPQLVFEVPAALPVTDEHTAVIARSDPDHAVILSGLPAYQGVTFNLPLNARPTSGYLQIDATLQVLAGVEGVLRISIDNTRRGEMLLHPGEAGRSLQISLSPTELAREQLVVSFSLQGDGPSGHCPKDTGYAAVVEIETTSALHLTLDRPLSTLTDRVNAWGGVVRVGWPDWLEASEKTRRLVLATQFKQHGTPTAFLDGHSDDALSTAELRETLAVLAGADAKSSADASAEPFVVNGSNAGLRRFLQETRWRITVDLRNRQDKHIPVGLDLQLALGRQALGDQWSVTVTLNDRLLQHDLLGQSATRFETLLALPPDLVAASNVIEVRATSTRTRDSLCSRPFELVAEMLPETTLIKGEALFSDALIHLRPRLSAMGALRLGTLSDLSAADADAGSGLLAQILPVDVTVKPANGKADIFVVTPNDAISTLPDAAEMWFISQDTVTRELIVDQLAHMSALPRKSLGILIIPDGADLAEVTL
jgi:hypothetical protein